MIAGRLNLQGALSGAETVGKLDVPVTPDGDTSYLRELFAAQEDPFVQQAPKTESRPAQHSGAMREKRDAIPYDLVPFQEMTEAYARVAEFGARKYAPWNWSLGLKRVQILSSLLRHAFAYMRGEDRDRESGLLHTDHILWNAAALSHNVHWNLEDGRRGEPARDYKAEV